MVLRRGPASLMPQVTEIFLWFVAGMVLLPVLARGRAWPIARDLFSAVFLGWFDPAALGMLVGAAALLSVASPRRPGDHARHRVVGLALLTLVFIAARLRLRFQGIGMPLGFGFAVLRIGHYWVERTAGTLPAHTPRDLLGWLIYAPTILVGPVQRFDDWMRWERRHTWDAVETRRGLWRVLIGYVKLVPLGFYVVGEWLSARLMVLPPSVAATVGATLLLYASFAGMSDIAVGLGRVWGQRVPENFDSPFLRTDLPTFWRSWHMTVAEWVRTYVYMPLFAATRKPLVAAGIGIGIFAFWHELSLAFVAWGAWQGLGLTLWHRVATAMGDRWRHPAVRAVSLVLTWLWLGAGWWFLHIWPRGDAWYAR